MIGAIQRFFIKNAFFEERESIYERVAEEMEGDGAKRMLTISEMFAGWAERDGKRQKGVAVAYASVANKINNTGCGLADAIAHLVPFEERMLIWAGEQNGKLPEALRSAIRIKIALAEMKDAVNAALAQPVFGFVGVVLTSWFMGSQLWPDMLRSINESYWPRWALPAIYFDLWITKNWPVLFIVGILIAVYHYSLPRWTGRVRHFVDRFPPYSVYREENANILLTTLAGFLSNRFVITDACIEINKKATPYLRWHLNRIIPRIEAEGDNVLEAFNTGLLSRAVIDRLEDAKRTRDLDKTIIHVGDKALSSLVRIVKLRANILNTVGTAVVGIFVLYSAAVQLIATQDATNKYTSQLAHGRPK
jgi:type II secretory pathway component PulF